MMHLAVTALGYAGFAAISVSMHRHFAQVFGAKRVAPLAIVLRAGGWLLLLGALIPSVLYWRWSVGVTAWLGLLSIAALAFVLLFSHWPRLAASAALPVSLLAFLILGNSSS